MPSRSNESLSLVHERCVKCGQLLPCALHDRELKRAILRERDEEPTFEKVWEGGGIARSGSIAWTSESCFFALSKNRLNLCLAERDEGSNTWRMREIDVSPIVQKQEWKHVELVSLALLETGKILLNFSQGQLVLLDPHVNAKREFEMLTVHDSSDASPSFVQMLPLHDGSCLAVPNIDYLNSLFHLFPQGSRWSEEEFYRPRKQSLYTGIKYIQPLSDGSFLLKANGRSAFFIFRLPANNISTGWSLEELRRANGSVLRPINSRGAECLPMFIEPQFVIFAGNLLHLCRPDPESEGAWRADLIGESCDGRNYGLVHALTGSSLLASTVDGAIDYWTRVNDDSWKVKSIARGFEKSVDSISHPANDPNSFMVHQTGGQLAYYRLPLDKLRAYHERQAAQISLSPLPPEI